MPLKFALSNSALACVLVGCTTGGTTTGTPMSISQVMNSNRSDIENGSRLLAFSTSQGAQLAIDNGVVGGFARITVGTKSYTIPAAEVGLLVNRIASGATPDGRVAILRTKSTVGNETFITGVIIEGTNLVGDNKTNHGQTISSITSFMGGNMTPEAQLPQSIATYSGSSTVFGKTGVGFPIIISSKFDATVDFAQKKLTGTVFDENRTMQTGTLTAILDGSSFDGTQTGTFNGATGTLSFGGGFYGSAADGIAGVVGGKVGAIDYTGFVDGTKN